MILGPIALILGILGLNYVKAHPRAGGTGHAWAGVILGALTTLAHIGGIVLIAAGALSARNF
jgi:hypothetical protein